eukprot:1139110-Pelagomonas_calceolata.AAC.2
MSTYRTQQVAMEKRRDAGMLLGMHCCVVGGVSDCGTANCERKQVDDQLHSLCKDVHAQWCAQQQWN